MRDFCGSDDGMSFCSSKGEGFGFSMKKKEGFLLCEEVVVDPHF